MNHNQILIANETTEELNNLKEIIRKMHLSQTAKFQLDFFLDSSQKRLHDQSMELDMIKMELIIKLQQEIILEIGSKLVDPCMMMEVESTVLNMFEDLQQKIPLNDQTVNMRVVITLMDFKIHLSCELQPALSMQQLLSALDQIHLWQQYSQSKHTYVIFFYLCLIYEYLSMNQTGNALHVMLELITLLIKRISFCPQSQKTSQLYSEFQKMLLTLHLSFKSIKKHFPHSVQLSNQSKIYVLLYELDHTVIEESTYLFRKQFNRDPQQALAFIKKKIAETIVKYDEKTIEKEFSLIKQSNKKVQFKIKKNYSAEAINRRKSLAALKMREGSSKKLIAAKQLKIQKNMFISKMVKNDVFLSRKLKFRKDKIINHNSRNRLSLVRNDKEPLIEEKDNSINEGQNKSESQKGENDKKRSISYEACKKISLNRNFELQLMICPRANSYNLSLNAPNKQDRETNRFYHDSSRRKNRLGKKLSIRYSSKQNDCELQPLKEQVLKIELPPTINKTLQQYIVSFKNSICYQNKKKSLPLYQYFSQIDMKKPHFLKGSILNFTKIEFDSLMVKVSFVQNENDDRIVTFNLLERDQNKIRSFFIKKKEKNVLTGFFFVGKIISLFTLNVETSEVRHIEKMKIIQISPEKEIYAHRAIINLPSFQKYHVKTILKAQTKFMDEINRSLELSFNYELPLRGIESDCKEKMQSRLRLWQLLRPDPETRLILQQIDSLKVSCRWDKKRTMIDIQIKRNIQTSVYYLIFHSFLQRCFRYYAVLPLAEVRLDQIVANFEDKTQIMKIVRSKRIIQRQWKDVEISQIMYRLPSKQYVSRQSPKGYKTFTSKVLIDKSMIMISGQVGTRKWFFFLVLADFQPTYIACLHQDSKRELKKITRKSIYGSHSNRSLSYHVSHSNKSLPPSKDEMVELWRKQQIRNISVENDTVLMDRRRYRVHFFDYSWSMYVKDKFYHCFYRENQVVALKLFEQRFIYFGKYKINPQSNKKQVIYSHFRRKLTQELTTFKLLLFEQNMLVILRVEKGRIKCKVDNVEDQCEITLEPQEFTMFDLEFKQLNYTYFKNRRYMRRLRSAFKDKYIKQMEDRF